MCRISFIPCPIRRFAHSRIQVCGKHLRIKQHHSSCGSYTRKRRRENSYNKVYVGGASFYTRLEEAVRASVRRVWCVVAFAEWGFELPGGSNWWAALAEAKQRRVDVRVLFWQNEDARWGEGPWCGPRSARAWGKWEGLGLRARWDSSGCDGQHCHHQKAFVVDDAAFVGGMPLHHCVCENWHDTFLEVQGSSMCDVAHNFVQRWSQPAADEKASDWTSSQDKEETQSSVHGGTEQDLGLDSEAYQDDVQVQVLRSIKPGLYHADPDAGLDIFSSGEASILWQYEAAFEAAQHSILIESQHCGEASLLHSLQRALDRGVVVVYIVPAQPMLAIRAEKRRADEYVRRRARYLEGLAAGTLAPNEQQPEAPHYASVFEQLTVLSKYENFTMAALYEINPDCAAALPPAQPPGRAIYVHSKLCVVDASWGMLGSANLVDLSLLRNHTELNVAFWDAESAMHLLNILTALHLGFQTSNLSGNCRECKIQSHTRPEDIPVNMTDVSGCSQIRALAEAARMNTYRLENQKLGHPAAAEFRGRIFCVDAAVYGVK